MDHKKHKCTYADDPTTGKERLNTQSIMRGWETGGKYSLRQSDKQDGEEPKLNTLTWDVRLSK